MAKVILNPSTSALNVVGEKDLTKVIKMTLSQLSEKLLEVSGPYSKNAFIMKNTKSLMEGSDITTVGRHQGKQEFTRDGIDTLSQIEYVSPIQRYIKDEILTWMGERIDANCHDGTTTSMLFTASFIMYMLDHKDTFTFYSNSRIEEAYNRLVEEILKRLENYKLTPEKIMEYTNEKLKNENLSLSLEQARVLIAHMQAATSSAGRKDVIDAVSTIVAHSPTTGEPLAMNFTNPKTETVEVGITSSQDEWDYSLPITLLDHTLLDGKSHTFDTDCADVLLLRMGLSRDTMTAQAIVNHLNSHKDEYKNENKIFIILIPSSGRNQLDIDWLYTKIAEYKKDGVTIFPVVYERPFNYNVPGEFWFYADGLNAKADVPDVDELKLGSMEFITIENNIIPRVKVHADLYQMYFKDIIPMAKLNAVAEKVKLYNMHPGEFLPNLYPHYTAAKDYFKEQIELYKSQIKENYENIITDLRRTITDITTYRPWYININGKKHDIEMYKSIIKDAAGASMIALSDGLFFNGPSKLFAALASIISDDEYPKDQVDVAILSCMILAAKDMVYAMFGSEYSHIANSFEDILGYSTLPYGYVNIQQGAVIMKQMDNQPFSYLHPKTRKPFVMRHIQIGQDPEQAYFNYVKSIFWPKMLTENDPVITPPCQVGNLFEVLFHRLREVSLRLILTDNLIAPDAMWDDGSLSTVTSPMK